ncbi:MAG: type VI secretion protein IcmF/TssM N-terminal domain-containing protein [Nibricoccus sp.]
MWQKWLRLPLAIRILIIVLALLIVLGIVALIDRRAVWFVLGGILFVGLLLGGFLLYKSWKKKRASQAFNTSLDRANIYASSVSDPSQRARLTDLREVFEKGLKAFSDAGKNLYSLPWYLVCGEPGSGKTETIRHSNVGFPPGLQDEMQGVGGTINMHWWFTNHAVLLDTAGKMLFHEAQPGATSEWLEFLKLLKTHRKNCPINGLLLVIPAESLLKDSPDEIQRKAGRIVRQLEQIQKVLDVRFPVFVLITKCDLIYGFREFFASVNDPQMQQQMLGWSNPEPLDVPFRPDLVTSFIDSVTARFRKRRLLLMRDPVPAAAGGRRLDEVDSFFDFPASVEAITPRLKQYLDVVFVSGEWTQKPLFLRGIYFTSALIEGKALDVELASALGIPVDHLPDQKSWDRNRSFFLRDLFMQKIFCEKGLVTDASDTRAIVRRRYTILGAVAAAGVALLMLVSWLGASALKNSVVSELAYWETAADGWSGDRWHPIVTPGKTAGEWHYAGNENVQVGRKNASIVNFHDELEKLASRDISVPWIFKPMESMVVGLDEKRRQAQKILFERSVVEPLVSSVRSTLLDPSVGWDDINSERMALLLKLEGMINQRSASGKLIGVEARMDPDYFFHATLQPWLGMTPVPHELVRVFDATLQKSGRGPWPAAWLSAGRSFEENRPISQGWVTLTNAVRNVRADQQAGVDLIRHTRVAVELHLTREKNFIRAVHAHGDNDHWQNEVDTTFDEMSASRSTVEEMLNRTAALDGMPSSLFTLKSAYQAMFEHARERSRAAARAIAAACVDPSDGDRKAQRPPELPLFIEIRRRLADVDKAIEDAYQESLTPGEMSSIPKLDMEATVPAAGTSDRVYSYRFGVFRDVLAQMYVRTESTANLVGRLNNAFSEQQAALSAINGRAMKYEGELRADFTRTASLLVRRASTDGPINLVDKYSREFEQLLVTKAGFPIIRGAGGMKEAQMRELFGDLQNAAADGKVENVPESAKTVYARLAARINQVTGFVRAVAKPTGQGAMVKVSVASLSDQRRLLEKIAPSLSFADAFAGNRFRTLRFGDKAVRTQAATAAEITTVIGSEQMPELEFFMGAETKPKGDARASVSGNWGPLRLIGQEKNCMPLDGGKTWLCPVEIISGESRTYFVLSLQFEQPVPTVDQWP